MWRTISTIVLSALIGSVVGMAVVAALEGGDWLASVFVGLVILTLAFTIPGTAVLTGASLIMARRKIRRPTAAAVIMLTGTTVGAGMLACINPDQALTGAMFGSLTAAAFLCVSSLFSVYPAAKI